MFINAGVFCNILNKNKGVIHTTSFNIECTSVHVNGELSFVGKNLPPGLGRNQGGLLLAVDCHESYMLILHLGDETYAKTVWMARALFQPNFGTSSPQF